MALIVEDGTGRADSESYATVAYADDYHTKRGNTAWTALTESVKEQLLRKATDFMIQEYRDKWQGRRVKIEQALDWPRVGVVLRDFGSSQGRTGYGSYYTVQVDYTIVPKEVAVACCELALRAVSGALLADLTQQVASEAVGPISVSYFQGARRTVQYLAVERNVAPLFMVGPNSARIVRC